MGLSDRSPFRARYRDDTNRNAGMDQRHYSLDLCNSIVEEIAAELSEDLKIWHLIVEIFFKREPQPDMYGGEPLRKGKLDEAALEVARKHAVGLPHSGPI